MWKGALERVTEDGPLFLGESEFVEKPRDVGVLGEEEERAEGDADLVQCQDERPVVARVDEGEWVPTLTLIEVALEERIRVLGGAPRDFVWNAAGHAVEVELLPRSRFREHDQRFSVTENQGDGALGMFGHPRLPGVHEGRPGHAEFVEEAVGLSLAST